jgi:hypothetical protein
MNRIIAALFALALLSPPDALHAEGDPPSPPTPAARAGLEAASIVGTIIYTPVKGALCVVGAGVSPLLYVSSGPKAAREVMTRTCKGTWFITPEVLRGDEPFVAVKDTPCCGYRDP